MPENSTTSKGRGRPKLPRDENGNIIRGNPKNGQKKPAKLDQRPRHPKAALPPGGYGSAQPVLVRQQATNAGALLGYTPNTLRKFATLGMPIEENPSNKHSATAFVVSIPDAVAWLIEHFKNQALTAYKDLLDKRRSQGEDIPLSKTEEEMRLLRANADVRQHQASLLSRESVELEYAIRLFSAAMLNFRAEREGIAGRRATEFAGMTNPATIRQCILMDEKRALENFQANLTAAVNELLNRSADEIESDAKEIEERGKAEGAAG